LNYADTIGEHPIGQTKSCHDTKTRNPSKGASSET